MPKKPQSIPDERSDAQAVVTWRVHPARSQPVRGLAASATIGAAALLSAAAFGAPWVAPVATVGLVLSLHQFFFGVDYRGDPIGLQANALLSRRYIRWAGVRRCNIGPRGMWISESPAPGWREERRGVLVLFDGDRERRLRQMGRWSSVIANELERQAGIEK